jgi:hypothetical protein
MVRAIIGMLTMLGSLSLAHAGGGPAPITQYETPAGQLWAPYSSDLPKCEDPWVLWRISNNFYEAEKTYWGGRHAIGAFEKIREIGFRANGLSYIPRRYCVGRAIVGDPLVPASAVAVHPPLSTVVYSIGAAEGFAGFTWSVEWCVVGLDREHAYSPRCLIVRPILERWLGEHNLFGEYGLKARY